MKKLTVFFIGLSFATLCGFGQDLNNEKSYLSYFNQEYVDCRKEIIDYAQKFSQKFDDVELINIKVPSRVDQELFVDVVYIPAQKASERLLILSSGTHGIEGYVGNAVQEMFIERFLTSDLLENTGVLLIHGLNPYGFKYKRRVTENNVDLNRNSDTDPTLYNTINSGYADLYDFLNPTTPVRYGSLGNKFFVVKAIRKIIQASLPVLRQAVLQGQYSFPDGLYFGGNKREPHIEQLATILERFSKPYPVVMNIDLHTGYGERGKLHFFPNPISNQDLREKTESVFSGYQIDWGDSDDFYTITGDFSGYITKLIGNKTHIPMTFEYGTMDSQKTMGSIRSIHNMILENQGVHHGYRKDKDQRKVEKNILEMYYPSDPEWRNKIMIQTEEVFRQVLPTFVMMK